MCFRSYGRDAISTNAYDQDEARRLCHFATDYEPDCVLSVALHITQEERGTDGAHQFCQDTPKDLRMYCYVGLGVTAQLLYPDQGKRQVLCRRFTKDPQEQFACTFGQFPG
jgi:hypothetical protein